MKPKFYLFLAGAFACLPSNAEVHKQGLIAGETWTKTNSPYIIDGAIFVASLTIDPGVEVKFSGDYVFEVGGVFTAIGSQNDSIRFTRETSVVTWKGILFQNSLPGSVMKWCVVEYANTSGIRINESFPQLSNCYIRNNTSPNSGGG